MPGRPHGGERAPTSFGALLSQIVKTFVISDFRIKSMQVDGDKVAVHWHAHMRSTINGEEADTEIVDLIELRDGRIASFLEFCDTADGAADADGLTPAARRFATPVKRGRGPASRHRGSCAHTCITGI